MMIVKGFRIGYISSTRKVGKDIYKKSYEGALFLAPTKYEAIAWAAWLYKANMRLYYVEVELYDRNQIERNRHEHLREIVIKQPYRILRFERVKDIHYREITKYFRSRLSRFQQQKRSLNDTH